MKIQNSNPCADTPHWADTDYAGGDKVITTKSVVVGHESADPTGTTYQVESIDGESWQDHLIRLAVSIPPLRPLIVPGNRIGTVTIGSRSRFGGLDFEKMCRGIDQVCIEFNNGLGPVWVDSDCITPGTVLDQIVDALNAPDDLDPTDV